MKDARAVYGPAAPEHRQRTYEWLSKQEQQESKGEKEGADIRIAHMRGKYMTYGMRGPAGLGER